MGNEPERVLSVHAHPGDESITTGGTITTRYDKYALTYRGGALLAATILHAKPI